MKNLLPNKLSDCIDVALKDLDAAKKLGFKVDMNSWYQRKGKTCTVCLAGAVIAREFDLDNYESVGPSSLCTYRRLITKHDENRLYALNLLRQGFVSMAVSFVDTVDNLPHTMLSSGNLDTKEWRKDMHNIRDYLREQGL
jgi:hypothetical protein